MKTIIAQKHQLFSACAEKIAELIGRKPDAVIAFSWEEELSGLFPALTAMVRAGKLSFAEAKIVSVCELTGSDALFRRLWDHFLAETDARPENCFCPTEESPERLDARIEQLGGLDMAVLGIGLNARIGFNEPATPFETLTHAQKLTSATRRELAALLGEENVPAKGIGMGIKTLTLAKEVCLLACGEEKAKPVFNMLYGRTDSFYPAAFLQLPPEVTVFTDTAAGNLL